MSTAVAMRPTAETLTSGFNREQVERRIWYRASQTSDGCREFLGHLNRGGYGVVKVGGKTQLAHRMVWRGFNGPIPVGMEVCHRCDNRRCVALEHLFLGTRRDNQRDMYGKGRGRKASGEAHGRAKLTVAQVRDIRTQHAAGASYSSLARQFHVDRAAVTAIVQRKHWREA